MKNPLLIGVPEQFETERLLIRMPLPGDGKAVYEAIQASLEPLRRWMPWAQKEQTEEETEINVREAHVKYLQRLDLRLHIFHKETGEFIGCSGLHRMNWQVPKFEIGYWIDIRHGGRGYMTEAVRGITDVAFRVLNARRVEIRCDTENVKSRAIPERLGFDLEGILRHDQFDPATRRVRDTCVFAKIR